jgi:hypothetical protein
MGQRNGMLKKVAGSPECGMERKKNIAGCQLKRKDQKIKDQESGSRV